MHPELVLIDLRHGYENRPVQSVFSDSALPHWRLCKSQIQRESAVFVRHHWVTLAIPAHIGPLSADHSYFVGRCTESGFDLNCRRFHRFWRSGLEAQTSAPIEIPLATFWFDVQLFRSIRKTHLQDSCD